MIHDKHFIDEYDYKAMLIPGLVASIPFWAIPVALTLGNKPLNEVQLNKLSITSLAPVLFVFIVFVFILAWFSRILSILIWEKRLFMDGLNFPTTQLLLESDFHLTTTYKKKLIQRIEFDSGITLPSAENKWIDASAARRMIKDAIKVVKAKTRQCPLTHKYLIDYGLTRNFVGACVIGGATAIALAVIHKLVFESWMYTILESLIALIYIFFVCIGDKIIKQFGFRYAEKMFEDYSNLS